VVGATRRESGTEPATGARGLTSLPTALAAEYKIEEELHPGAEADVLQIVDAAGRRRVAKIYRRGIHPDPTVWMALPRLTSDHVVKILDTGSSDGRDYEVMEYAAEGNLTGLLHRGRLSAELIRAVVVQIADALVTLHRQSIVHRDLKPENVLVRRLDDAGIDLAVTDFGLARMLEYSVVHASRSGTLAYQPPEALLPSGAEVSNKWDWWSLGMIVRELATGVRAHAQMSAPAVEKALLIHGLDVGDVVDPRLRLLCRGLLTHNARDRWGADEVARWRDGEDVPVTDSRGETAERVVPFRFEGVEYRSRESLARGLQDGWAAAARRFFAAMGSPDSPAEGWRRLRAWLQQFADDPSVDRDAFEELIDHTLVAPTSTPDRRLLALIRWLDPSLPVVYRGTPISRENLIQTARLLRHREAPDHAQAVELFQGLFTPGFVADIARSPHYAWLAEVDQARRALRGEEIRFREYWSPYVPPGVFPNADAWMEGALLDHALDPGRSTEEMWQIFQQQRASLPAPIAWYETLAQRASGYIDYLGAVQVYPAAFRQATVIRQEQERQTADRLAREAHWLQVEQQRTAATHSSLTLRYLLPVTAVAAALVVGLFLVLANSSSTQAGDWANVSSSTQAGDWVYVMINMFALGGALAYLWISELQLARTLGGDYARWTRFSQSGRGHMSFLSDMTAGKGCLLLVLALVIVPILISAPLILGVIAAVFQLLSIRRRQQNWKLWHDRAYHEIMGRR
jgi:serine/threonine protein kinase